MRTIILALTVAIAVAAVGNAEAAKKRPATKTTQFCAHCGPGLPKYVNGKPASKPAPTKPGTWWPGRPACKGHPTTGTDGHPCK